MSTVEFANQRRDRHHFAQRHCVHPDQRPVIGPNVGRPEAEPLRKSPPAARLGKENGENHR
jgi:hypothetical protein